MKLHVNTWFQIRTKDKKGSPIGKAHIMAKKKVQWQNLPKYLDSLIIFVSSVYAFRLGMQLTPYMLNLRVADRLGRNKIQCSLAYKFLFMLQWLRHDVLLSIVIPGRLIWWWCQELIHVPYEDNGVVCCQIGKLLPTYTFLVGLFLNTGKQVTKLSVFCIWDIYIELLILFLRKD